MDTRRTFLKTVAAGSFLNLNPAAMGANEKVTLALIGGRNQGRGDALRTIQAGGQFKTFCDLDPAMLEKTGAEMEKAQGTKPQLIKEYQRVLDDKDIDAVMIAVPDHWHAILTLHACQAGKDVYIEKPLCQTIREGQMMRDAARKYNRVVQVGTQRRSVEHVRSAVELVAGGKIGKVPLIKAWINQIRDRHRQSAGRDAAAGSGLRRVAGARSEAPVQQNRFHYIWRYFWDYGNSEIGNQGIHVLDVALSAIQSMKGMAGEKCMPRRVSATGGIYWLKDAKEVPDTQIVTYDYGDMLLNFELRSFATDYLTPHSAARGQARNSPADRPISTRPTMARRQRCCWANDCVRGPLEGREGGHRTKAHRGQSRGRISWHCVKSREAPECGYRDRAAEHDAVPPGQHLL